ncbi:type II secretion system F family protein [Hyperthermus butylicus]|uniref:Type II secretion system protein GspF domain-containing protein n=1 Tax=Hyperthermus butylicus (strain DSM 5456 / JCM 9403 / PLM1-5) TaxID=415426 RepID=A2BJC2_HYPBU|nr:type II secretion system F family protein [Hyperthermus butylicus]ABM80083.1 hypothetical protein Hbut_0211 [Hyperthermus butylicus DSM 5456]
MARLAAIVTVILSIVSVGAWLAGYPHMANVLASFFGLDWVKPYHTVKFVYFVPVIADRGTMIMISGAIVAAMVPVYFYARQRYTELRMFEEQLIEFLLILPGMLAASPSTADALLRTARMLRPPFNSYVERMARIYASTGDLERAFNEAFTAAPSKVRILARSVVTAAKTGGHIHIVLSKVAAYADASRRLVGLAEARLSEYKMIAGLAAVAYALTAGVTVALVAQATAVPLPGMTTRIDTGVLAGLYFYSLIMIVVASSIVIARVVYGYIALASKYIAMLLPLSLAVYLAAPIIIF